MEIHCIEPFPFDNLRSLPNIDVQVDEVQNVYLAVFEALDAGDLLFIDSSHVV